MECGWLSSSTAANSSLPGKVPVNDTDSGVGLYPRETVERGTVLWPFNEGVLPKGVLAPRPITRFVYPFTFQESGSIPCCSPFALSVSIQMYLYFLLAWWTKRSCFLHHCNFLLLCVATAVLPVCSHCSDRYLRTRLLYPLRWCSSHVWHSIPRVSPRTFHTRYLSRLKASGLEWMAIFDPGGTNPTRVSCSGIVPWDKVARLGEATNPGPVVKFSTLNIVSAGKNQSVMLEPQTIPSVQVYTETCMTKVIQESLSRKVRSHKKAMISSALWNPRQNVIRGASYTRGQSGGVLIMSDIPAQPGHFPMPLATWASTRVVDAVVAAAPGFHIRILGIYGITAKIKTHADMTNDLLRSILGSVAHSTLPCLIMGDFNCPLEELVSWPSMQLHGWVDAATWNETLTGLAPQMTYRGETRIDFILVSPELRRYWQQFECIPDTVSDHAQLELYLQIPAITPTVLRWKTCRDSAVVLSEAYKAGWDSSTFTPRLSVSKDQDDVQQAFQNFVVNFEDMVRSAHACCNSLLPVKNFLGRSRPKKIHQPLHAPVVRTPRHGEHVPQVDDAPTKLRQHIRQCRRLSSALEQLISYTRTQSESALQAALETWQAVLHAAGFEKGFKTFAWEMFGIQIPEALQTQDVQVVRLVLKQMQLQQPKWMYQLANCREHSHRLFLNDDWSKGGRVHAMEIKPPPKPEVAMMDVQEQGIITRLRHSKNGPFWVACEGSPPPTIRAVLCNGIRYGVIGVDECKLQLTKPVPGPSARLNVVFLSPTSDISVINNLTLKFWEQYWCGADQPDLEEIDHVLQMIPPVPCFSEYCTPNELQEAIAQSKPARARGPDNWSNEDLKAMPPVLVKQLCEVFNAALEQGSWPASLLESTVALVPKEDVVHSLDDTRPVTVLSAVYRIWSRIVTRKFLHNAHAFLPGSIQGNRQQASSVWLATHIQLQLEYSLWFGLECNVASVDLKKAFNLISRAILAHTGNRFGIPTRVVQLHQTFLSALTRSFRVVQQISPGMGSERGVPEGCGFSVCAMLQLNWIMSAKFERDSAVNVNAQFYNYVDNWLFMSHTRASILHSLGVVHDFAPKGCFRVSSGKTWASSTSPQVRQAFRSTTFSGSHIQVPVHKVEIGLLLRFNKKACTGPVSQRWEAGLERVDRLLTKKWSTERKIATIQRVVFPQLFAGCQSVHISLSTFQRFRGKLNVAIHSFRSTGSHFLSPLVTHRNNYEPFLYVFHARLSALRATCISFGSEVHPLWNALIDVYLPTSQTKILGPLSCFVWCCQVLGWTTLSDLRVQNPEGTVLHLIHSPLEQWHDVAEQAWWNYAYSKCKWRDEWKHLHISIHDWRALWSRAKTLPPLTGKFRTFGVLSGTARARMKGHDEVSCELCGGAQTGQRHLVLECPATKLIRDQPKFACVFGLNTFTLCAGIPVRSVPWTPLQWPSAQYYESGHEWTHVFTDGSASPPEFPGVRMSSWSVVGCRHVQGQYYEGASGLTPGYVHNIARAETYAVLQGMKLARSCTFYIDNQGVVTNLRKILSNGYNPLVWRGHPNVDLWTEIAGIVVSRGPACFQVIKVKSHQEAAAATAREIAWIIKGNDKADRLAKQHIWEFVQDKPQLQNRGPKYDQFIQHTLLCSAMLQEISQLVFQTRKEKERESPGDFGPAGDNQDAGANIIYSPHVIDVSNIPSSSTWDARWLDVVVHYFSLLQWPTPEPMDPRPCSMLELMLDCLIAFQIRPPVNMRLFSKRHTLPVGVDTPSHETQYVMFSRHEASLFPPTMLTDASYIWLRTFDFLQPLLKVTPYPRASLYALGNFGFCNSSPSMPVRPQLLCGQLVSQLLASTLVPGVRVLKYPLVITPAEPRPLPSSFPPNF